MVPNGGSLDRMGLTRERGCCTGDVGRLDVNTHHKRVYITIYYYIIDVVHILGLRDDIRHLGGPQLN